MLKREMNIADYDAELWQAMEQEKVRQEEHIELIASENYTSPRVMQAQGSQLTNKYAEGYPGKRYYGGCEYVDIVEQLASRGLSFDQPPPRIPRTNARHYQDPAGRLYHRRLAHLLTARGLLPDIRIRLARYYDELLVDEVQDFAGHDFNFLLELCRAEITVLCCGDFYQHTFDTSHDGNVNSTLHDDITRYEARFDAAGFAVDRDTLNRTWRCSASVCEFITGQLNIRIAALSRATGLQPSALQAGG